MPFESGVVSPDDADEMIHRWVDTWRTAAPELEAIRRREAAATGVQEAIRQIFDGMESTLTARGPATSGLVEQQMWFSRIRTSGTSPRPAEPQQNT